MADVLLAPLASAPARSIGGGVWRKQILRKGVFDYKGRKLDFSDEYLRHLVKAFEEKAYDAVPFMLADESNRHTMAPERAQGQVIGLVPTEDGLDAIVKLSSSGSTIVKENPNFGVSARIVEGLERGDGYKTPAAIQHLLGTWDPRMTGLSPWESVELSTEESDEIIDLTLEEGSMPLTKEQEERLNKLLDLPDEQFEALLTQGEDEGGDEELSEEDAERILAEMIAEHEAGESEGESAEEDAEEGELVGLANEGDDEVVIELAALREDQANLRRELSRAQWEKERVQLASQGVPPAMLDLAEPVLTADETTIDLSNGRQIDSKSVVRKLLKEATGYIDMSDERGHQGDPADNELEQMHAAADALGWE